MRTLLLRKGQHTYLFRYAPGGEADILQAVADLASAGDNDFDWVDAATLSFQVTYDQATSCLHEINPTAPHP